ncbi:MAG: tetratricopeptide repeat protein [Candidatus Omnitrophica bacterium]|nr:tetratricopeptide repeat protein [Candidatus Omnitrophota bacterium]
MTRVFGPPLALLCICFLVFANTLSHPFVHDDIVLIVQNPHIGRWDHWLDVFWGPSTPQAVAGINAYYRPFLEIVYRFEYALFGLHPWGWHLFNVLVHAVNAALIYRLLMVLGFTFSLAWAVAVLFIVHPVQTEAVACVAGVSNLLMAFWVLSALIFYLKGRWSLSLGCFGLGLLTKEQSLMVVPLVVLVDWHRGQKRPVFWASFAAMAFSFLVFRQAVTGAHVLTDILASPGELKLRVLAIAQTLFTYIRVVLFPYDLHYYRSTDILSASLWWWPALIAAAFLIARAEKAVRFGALWFILALLPVLNIVPLINEYSLILTAEHFLYLPMVGIVVIGVMYGQKLFKKQAKWALVLVVAVWGMVAIGQNTFWRSETALFERAMAFEPNFARGHLLLAKAYYFDKRYEAANTHFDQAYTIMKGYAAKTMANINSTDCRGNRCKAANTTAQRFYLGFMKGILFDWAHSLEGLGRFHEAKDKYQHAIAIDPRDPVLWNNLGVLEVKMGDMAQAKSNFEKALEISPDFVPAKDNLRQFQSKRP